MIRKGNVLLTLKHYELLCVLAEELHFGRAAARLGVSQSQLTQHLKQMEEIVGALLFDRTRRRVSLSPAGALILPDARAFVRHARRAEDVALRAGRGILGELSLGYVGAVAFNGVLTRILAEFRNRATQIDLRLEMMDLNRQFPEVAAGNLDVGLVRLPYPDIPPDVVARTLHHEALWIALPENHPLAGADQVLLADLNGADFIATHLPPNTGFSAAAHAAWAEAGVTPNIVHRAPQFAAIVSLVGAGLGVAIVPEAMRRAVLPGVVYRPLRGTTKTAPIALIYRADRESPPLNLFLASIETFATEGP
ncbi:LysR family transcriptional regulator [Pseudotabrizicola sediminis]|uniref:LysR family transcriptional regulator n=1 Tax=Pseudotabrizicola sediminis TaxID=2486418 RepID=A0ABY2KL11_9RHOB|nr:LysR family transcriptional regulator [Pseudotabrizicola sediminis]TGD41909.1 LysR family transcriptional regulator [Pseudotabrizicola sediminis]